MNYPYFFVFDGGVICKQGDLCSACFVSEKGNFKTYSSKQRCLIKGKKLVFIRGIEYLFYSILFYINSIIFLSNHKNNQKNTEKSQKNVKFNKKIAKKNLIFIFGFILYFLLIYFLPIKISEWLSVFYIGEFFKRFVVAILKTIFFCSVVFLVRYIPSIAQIYRLNGACNMVTNSYVNVKMKKNYFRNTNFLTYIIFSFIFSFFVLSLIGLTISSLFNILVNLCLTLICFSVCFEICLILDKHENKFTKFISMCIGSLVSIEPSYSEVIVCQTALNEVILLRENKNREVNDEVVSNSDLIGFSFAYSEVREKLKSVGNYEISDVDWIFATVLDKTRTEIKLLYTIKKSDYKKIMAVTKRRMKGEPLSNIFGFQDFYGERFVVDERVLTPRPETEILCEEAIKLIQKMDSPKVLDLCTGSGAIGITLALNTDSKVTMSDISTDALAVAKQNCENLKAKVKLVESNLFENIKGKFDIIASNPPYIKSEDIKKLDIEVRKYDPLLALDGGEDGYAFYKRIISQAPKYLVKNGYILLEVGFSQANFIKKLLQKDFEDIIIVKDYNKIARVVIARKKG